jgi:hypothetical protein
VGAPPVVNALKIVVRRCYREPNDGDARRGIVIGANHRMIEVRKRTRLDAPDVSEAEYRDPGPLARILHLTILAGCFSLVGFTSLPYLK